MFTGEIRRARSKTPLYVGLGVVVVIAAIALLVPMPHPLTSTYSTAPVNVVELTVPRDGVIAEVVTADGAMVAKGGVIAKFDVSDVQQQLPDAEKQVAALEQRKASGGKVSPAAKAALAKAEGALKTATAALEKATKAGKGKSTPAMAAAQKKVDAAKAAVEKASLAAGPTGEELEKELTAAQELVSSLKAQLAAATLVAPGSGLVELKLEKGAAVKKDAVVGTVSDLSKLRVKVKVPAGEAISKGQAVELTTAAGKKRLTFSGPATGDTAEAEFDNAKGELKSGLSGEATIEGEQRSMLSGLMK